MANKLAPEIEKEQGWQQLNAPELHTWEKIGETIFGRLVGLDQIEVKGKKVMQYTLAIDKDHRLKLLATYDLSQKLTRAHMGMLVRIRYRGEDGTVKKGDNAMKVFDVHVKPDQNTPPERDGGPITDEDIPF